MSVKFASGILLVILLSFSIRVRAETETTTQKEHHVEKGRHHRPLAVDLWRDEVLIPWMARQFFWPWRQLSQAVAILEDDEEAERTMVKSDNNAFEISMSVKRFKPEEIKVSVKNRFVLVTGKHLEKGEGEDKKYVANQFEQRFALPPGAKPEEVTSTLENGVLKISAPIHPLPPPEPEREIPIKIVHKESSGDLNESSTEFSTENNTETANTVQETTSSPSVPPSSTTNRVETSSYHGKIRKKDLKNPVKKVPKKSNTSRNDESNNLEEVLAEAE